ncbi:MAG: hypothetical protein ACTSUC_09835 [Promethearchaeota archaeon]
MVSANQLSNSLGAVVVGDGEVPRTFTGKALETISGGYLVQVSGATNDVGSSVSSFTDTSITLIGAQNPSLCNGIALNNAGSNSIVTFATRGNYLMKVGGNVSGGALVGHNASGCIVNWKGNISGTNLINDTIIGRAVTTSASGTSYYSLVALNV